VTVVGTHSPVVCVLYLSRLVRVFVEEVDDQEARAGSWDVDPPGRRVYKWPRRTATTVEKYSTVPSQHIFLVDTCICDLKYATQLLLLF